MSATPTTVQSLLDEFHDPGPSYIDVEHCALAQDDLWRVKKYFRRTRKRRAVPPGTPPTELWLMCLQP
eukprot:4584566-Pyramimonas_sp.AAC.1